MCLCITKQETAHKGQARYRRQLLTGGGKRKLEKRNTRMSSDYAGFMSHSIHSSVRFFLYPISLPSGSKEQMIFSRTRKDFTAAKPQHKKAHITPKKDFRLIFFCLWSENSSKRKKAPQLQGHNCSIGQHTRIQLDCHCLQQQTEDWQLRGKTTNQ